MDVHGFSIDVHICSYDVHGFSSQDWVNGRRTKKNGGGTGALQQGPGIKSQEPHLRGNRAAAVAHIVHLGPKLKQRLSR